MRVGDCRTWVFRSDEGVSTAIVAQQHGDCCYLNFHTNAQHFARGEDEWGKRSLSEIAAMFGRPLDVAHYFLNGKEVEEEEFKLLSEPDAPLGEGEAECGT